MSVIDPKNPADMAQLTPGNRVIVTDFAAYLERRGQRVHLSCLCDADLVKVAPISVDRAAFTLADFAVFT